MPAWSVSNSSGTAYFDVLAGELEVTTSKATGLLWPLRGSNPIVQSGPTRVPTLSTPDWLTTSNSDHELLMSILTSGSRLTITTDLGDSYSAVVSGDIVVRIEDTPERSTRPRRRYQVPLVGVL
jgi:hypothetical protein